MFTYLMCLAFLSSPLLASVLKKTTDSCSPTEFSCGDGGCVSMELVCDGSIDCADGSDELSCYTSPINLVPNETVLHRYRRQASACRKDQWTCRDGSCISFDGKCDGIVDCIDGSDETHALCRNTLCQHNWFRCTYGACVDGTAPCNNIQDCADNSDELLPRCRNETDEVRGEFQCLDGTLIPAASHCDGEKNCPDGSDETVRTCGGKTCASYLFQCAYGACVDRGADCNKIEECADGSDEAFDLCGTGPTPTTTTVRPQGACVLPPFPIHGTYVTNRPNAKPGDSFEFVYMNITCRQGYGVDGSSSIYCYNGWWPQQIPKCISQCRLMPHPSVEYQCLVFGSVKGLRICEEYEPTGTVVRPVCRAPNYYSPVSLQDMRCISGNWDYTARCSPGLTKNGTNITILIKDLIEVYVSNIQYTVPINSSHLQVVPITDDDYNLNSLGGYESVGNQLYDNNNIKEASNNETTETKVDDSNYEIDNLDWRMGVPSANDDKNTHYGTQNEINRTETENERTQNENYVTESTTTTDASKSYDTEIKIDDNDFGIDDWDWRMGLPSTHDKKNTQYSTQNNNNYMQAKTKRTENKNDNAKKKIFAIKSNNTNINFNIFNSSVHIHGDV